MDVFDLRNSVTRTYASYIRSFITIRDRRIKQYVEAELERGSLWPDALIQLNPNFEPGEPLAELVEEGLLHPICEQIFRRKPTPDTDEGPLRLHRHQVDGIRAAKAGKSFILTTGTGSGKSLAYIAPIVDHVLRRGSGRGIQAIIIYPMNALANSQLLELEKFLCHGFPNGAPPITFKRYTGQESDAERQAILADPPDILLTNYVMLELLLTRPWEHQLVESAQGLAFLVLDELHTYRGRQGADVALLLRRVRELCRTERLLHVGTSATLAGGGAWAEQQVEVAAVASTLFGTEVLPESVIGETLMRVTPPLPVGDETFEEALSLRVRDGRAVFGGDAGDRQGFLEDPLASWTETVLGLLQDPESGRLVRREARALSGERGVAAELAQRTGVVVPRCEQALRDILLAGYRVRNEYDQPIFAFRVHQFVSKGESVYATLEPEAARQITLKRQKYAPESDREKVLLPLAFCRECGQEYYVVRRHEAVATQPEFLPRELGDRVTTNEGEPGFLYLNAEEPWPRDGQEVLNRLPDSWTEFKKGQLTLRKARENRRPREVFLSTDALEGAGELRAHYFRAPFLFCLQCRTSYDAHQTSDFGKLATLGSEGRSTATSILSLATLRELRSSDLEPQAQKLLSFTDNRQDASLQAGHFNDFVEVTLLRSGLWRAVQAAGATGIRHDQLTLRVFESLDLPLSIYALNPQVEYLQLEETQRAFRQVLGYHLYRDLRRGWRVTSPNLEQCGLLEIDYLPLRQFCSEQAKWDTRHMALSTARPEDREKVCRVILDFLRRELAIRVDYLNPVGQESLSQLSAQYLVPPWAFDESEKLVRSRIVLPRSRGPKHPATEHLTFLSSRGGLGLYLRRSSTFPDLCEPLRTEDSGQIICDVLEALVVAGIVHPVLEPKDKEDVSGYQLNAAALLWRAGDGSKGFHDPVRVPNTPEGGLRTNPFFIDFYQRQPAELKGLTAREHTAQVPAEIREQREEAFREARLPVLYCSPTMELGVDIAQLNVVNMRNVPPTPANYAQRSGRAGRSGQPAFVFTYCSSGSPHDQFFFKRPHQMVGGSVTPPRLDLTNEDLIRAHVQAIWLGVVKLSLGRSLDEVLDVSGDNPTFEFLPQVHTALANQDARQRAQKIAQAALGPVVREVVGSDGDPEEWLRRILDAVPASLDAACNRWRGLYRAALEQSKRQSRIVRDASRDARARKQARRLRNEAEAQLRLLLEVGATQHSDFYSYRYLASEGFLPGYNFPRLPLAAFIPGRRRQSGRDEFLSRPRFLAISEFGPRSILYHEGSRYVVNKVILPVEGDGDKPELTRRAVLCVACGYLHPIGDEPAPDLCEGCGHTLPSAWQNLFRMENVATRRRDRINSEEEERFRLGYELITGVRFATRGGHRAARHATLRHGKELLATLTYGNAATLWRINLGWRRRRVQEQVGFTLDVERGFWARDPTADVDRDPADPLSPNTTRVVPYVEDHRNCLLVEPAAPLDTAAMASLQAALKTAIQVVFQLEDRELAVEPLPSSEDRRLILLYEASEGGAGALRRLVEDPQVLPHIARTALEICHYDPETGEDLQRAPEARENCEAACYDCLLSYYNQRDHHFVDRRAMQDLLLPWAAGTVATSPAPIIRGEHLERLLRLCDSALERRWLQLVDRLGLALPDTAQELEAAAGVRPDFLYRAHAVAVFVDGPHHDDPRQIERDTEQTETLEDLGFHALRFHHAVDWREILACHPTVFGRITEVVHKKTVHRETVLRETMKTASTEAGGAAPAAAESLLDLDLFDDDWHGVLTFLVEHEFRVDAGADVVSGGEILGTDVAVVEASDQAVRLVDARDPEAQALCDALEAAGQRALLAVPDDPTLPEQIARCLGEAP